MASPEEMATLPTCPKCGAQGRDNFVLTKHLCGSTDFYYDDRCQTCGWEGHPKHEPAADSGSTQGGSDG